MRLGWLTLIALSLLCVVPVHAQMESSCLDDFRDFAPISPEINPTFRREIYHPIVTWYEGCLLVGSSDGLWLYDPTQPENPLQLVQLESRAINNVAVNPQTGTIAFNVGQESTVYFIDADLSVSTIDVSGTAITAIAFSPDNSLVAIASSEIEEDMGIYYDSRVEVYNADGDKQATLVRDSGVTPDVIFSADSQRLLTNDTRWGYIGDNPTYWEIANESILWTYNGLLTTVRPWLDDDPLVASSVTMNGDIVAVAGIRGYFNDTNFYGLGVHLWNADTQERLLQLVISGRMGNDNAYSLPAPIMAFNPDGSILAVSIGDENIQFWDTNNGDLIDEVTLRDRSINQLAYNADNTQLAVISDDTITLLDTSFRQEITSFSVVIDEEENE